MKFKGLRNLAIGKTARQSSTDKTHSLDDASRALADDGKWDFAFHTNIEENPWWQVDLRVVYPIYYIVIGNRRNMAQERAVTLTIETSMDGELWQLIHTGLVSWDGVDWVYPLNGLVSARFVRLSLREKTWLHLAKVEVWGLKEELELKKLKPPRLWDLDAAQLALFTINGKIPVMNSYFDNKPKATRKLTIKAEIYQQVFQQLEVRTFSYYRNSMSAFYDAFEDFPLAGQKVIVYGLDRCNCEAMALWQKAASVYVVDYNPPICEHPGITVITHAELEASSLTFDCAFSYSSFEHAGMGRYGDPIGADLDLESMRMVKKHLREGGHIFFGVPLGQDCLVWNAHRIYGPVRLPRLLDGWRLRACYTPPLLPHEEGSCFEMPLGTVVQPLLVLENSQKVSFWEDMKCQPNVEKKGTRDPELWWRIQEMCKKYASQC